MSEGTQFFFCLTNVGEETYWLQQIHINRNCLYACMWKFQSQLFTR